MKRIYTDEERKKRKREAYQRWKASNPEKAKANWKRNNEMKAKEGYHAERYKKNKVKDNKKSRDYYWANRELIAKKAKEARARKKAGLPGIVEEKRMTEQKQKLQSVMQVHNIFNKVRNDKADTW